MQEHHKYSKLPGSVTVSISLCSTPCPRMDTALTLTEKVTPPGVPTGKQEASSVTTVQATFLQEDECVLYSIS